MGDLRSLRLSSRYSASCSLTLLITSFLISSISEGPVTPYCSSQANGFTMSLWDTDSFDEQSCPDIELSSLHEREGEEEESLGSVATGCHGALMATSELTRASQVVKAFQVVNPGYSSIESTRPAFVGLQKM